MITWCLHVITHMSLCFMKRPIYMTKLDLKRSQSTTYSVMLSAIWSIHIIVWKIPPPNRFNTSMFLRYLNYSFTFRSIFELLSVSKIIKLRVDLHTLSVFCIQILFYRLRKLVKLHTKVKLSYRPIPR